MRVLIKNEPRLMLADLLRRRKMTLARFMSEFGITTKEGLKSKCLRLGVTPPNEADMSASGLFLEPGKAVSSPQEGVVVLDPPPIVNESTGKRIVEDAPMPQYEDPTLDEEPTAAEASSHKKKDEGEWPAAQTHVIEPAPTQEEQSIAHSELVEEQQPTDITSDNS